MGCTMLRSHAAPDNMLDVASRRCGRTGEDGVAAGGPVRPGRRGCSMGFQIREGGVEIKIRSRWQQ